MPMCLAQPARVVSVEGPRALVEGPGGRREVDVALVRVAPGGWCLVQGAVAVATLTAAEAQELLRGDDGDGDDGGGDDGSGGDDARDESAAHVAGGA